MTAPVFAPLPLLANPHLQTVLSIFVKRTKIPGPTRQYRVPLPDGDSVVLHDDVPVGLQPGAPVAVILHGLTGSHRSAGVTRLTRELLRRQVRTFRLDLRGAGAAMPYSRRLYNGGCSADVRAALAMVRLLAPDCPIWLVGTSLGGNIALKLAGELTAERVPGLVKVAAINPPIDLAACTALLNQRRNRFYQWHFVYELKREARKLARIHGEPDPDFPRRMTIMEFDDFYTAPRSGYSGAADYYRQASSLPLIPRISVPALLLTARDDPFIAVDPFEGMRAPANVEVRIVERGGHTGFLGHDGQGGIGWAEVNIAAWLLGR